METKEAYEANLNGLLDVGRHAMDEGFATESDLADYEFGIRIHVDAQAKRIEELEEQLKRACAMQDALTIMKLEVFKGMVEGCR